VCKFQCQTTFVCELTYFILIRFLDVRTKALAYEWKTTLATGGEKSFILLNMHADIRILGQVKTLAISPNAYSAVIGFTTGTVSVFDVRSGGILGTLKVPEGEILKVNNRNFFYRNNSLIFRQIFIVVVDFLRVQVMVQYFFGIQKN
jgi:hypothetical protein